ncbi:hypothetical protein Cci01nite_30460 [Catellatospora citrea]|uniref:Uncharacterized protein n=1 Tax=Catellatospora citrea TaxID=53366 RepID=A0A8J3K7J9_9ACTN|nr:hypothetical protein Cci01nite_30460 [Catellatospora citrea]
MPKAVTATSATPASIELAAAAASPVRRRGAGARGVDTGGVLCSFIACAAFRWGRVTGAE